MAGEVQGGRQGLILQGLQHLPAVVEEGVEGGFEHRPESAAGDQLLNEMGHEHQQEVTLGRHRISAVHVFQSEATVLEHVETLVFAAPPKSRGGGFVLAYAAWGGLMLAASWGVLRALLAG